MNYDKVEFVKNFSFLKKYMYLKSSSFYDKNQKKFSIYQFASNKCTRHQHKGYQNRIYKYLFVSGTIINVFLYFCFCMITAFNYNIFHYQIPLPGTLGQCT